MAPSSDKAERKTSRRRDRSSSRRKGGHKRSRQGGSRQGSKTGSEDGQSADRTDTFHITLFMRLLDFGLSPAIKEHAVNVAVRGRVMGEENARERATHRVGAMLEYHRQTIHGLRTLVFVLYAWAAAYVWIAFRNWITTEDDIDGSLVLHYTEGVLRTLGGICCLSVILLMRFSTKDGMLTPTRVLRYNARLMCLGIAMLTIVAVIQLIKFGYSLTLANTSFMSLMFGVGFPLLLIAGGPCVAVTQLIVFALAIVVTTIMEVTGNQFVYERELGTPATFAIFTVLAYTQSFYIFYSILMSMQDLFKRQKRTNNELLLARDEAVLVRDQKSYFLNYASHELRTPLHGLMGMLELAADELEKQGNNTPSKPYYSTFSKVVAAIEVCQSTGQHLVDITNSLLAWGRADRTAADETMDGTVELTKGSLKNCVTFALNALSGSAKLGGITLSVEWSEDREFERMTFDNSKCRQVIMNLVSNAVKYSPPGGKVSVKLCLASVDELNDALTEFHMGQNRSLHSVPPGDLIVDIKEQTNQTFRKSETLSLSQTASNRAPGGLLAHSTEEDTIPDPKLPSEDKLDVVMALPAIHKTKLSAPNVHSKHSSRRTSSSLDNDHFPYGVVETGIPMVVHVIVKDEGNGVAPENHAGIFKDFVTGADDNAQGTGLGLPICARLLDLMGGAIWVDSAGKTGEGSAFHFMLPAESFAQYLSPIITRDGRSPLSDLNELETESISMRHQSIHFSPALETKQVALTVLVVDDQALNLKLCKNMLTTLGYQCILCKNGFDAVKAYENGLDPLKRDHPRIRVALVDVQMPEMSGTEVYDAIREIEEKHDVPPCHIAMASAAHFAIPHESEDPDRYTLNKPFGRKTLDAFIRARLETMSNSHWSPSLPPLRDAQQAANATIEVVRPNLIDSRTPSELSPPTCRRSVVPPNMPNTINQ